MMSETNSTSVMQALALLQDGDHAAFEHIWLQYLPRLRGLARQTLERRRPRMVESNDIVQSVFFSFWRRADRGDFVGVLTRDHLWNLLAKITVRKSLNRIRDESAMKRGGGRVLGEEALGSDDSNGPGFDQALAVMPVHEFDLSVEELLNSLDADLREIALLRLAGHKNLEIAELLDCTEKKVERKLQKIRSKWEKELLVD